MPEFTSNNCPLSVELPVLEIGEPVNPLIIPLSSLLSELALPVSEYELLKSLEQRGCFDCVTADAGQLQLFQRHFLLMNALYQLQRQLSEQGWLLSVSALTIDLKRLQESESQQLSDGASGGGLRSYYSDWSHYEKTTVEDVDDLLAGFWQRFAGADQREGALKVLELAPGAGLAELRSSYRRLAATHHPDRGGSAEQFMAVREAYELLLHSSA